MNRSTARRGGCRVQRLVRRSPLTRHTQFLCERSDLLLRQLSRNQHGLRERIMPLQENRLVPVNMKVNRELGISTRTHQLRQSLHRLRRGRNMKHRRLGPDGSVGDMGTLRDPVCPQKLQKVTARRSPLKVENACLGQQIRQRRKKRRKIGLAGYLQERACRVETNAAHLFPRYSTEDFGEQAHGVRSEEHTSELQ